MNKQPVSYLQTDPRWAKLPYRAPGESATIGGSGCGPSCAAMLIETLTGQTYTPEDACNWSMAHGYKALNQGTYYSYFVPQFKEFGIACKQLNGVSLYGKPGDAAHDKAFELLKQGYYLIACMGKGLWTSSGHFVVVWWEDGKVRINDPASTRQERLNGDVQTFRRQVKYYWAVDAREYNKKIPTEEDDDTMTQEQFDQMMDNYLARRSRLDDAAWGAEWEEAKKWAEETGLIKGDQYGNKMYQSWSTRQTLVLMLYRKFQKGV